MLFTCLTTPLKPVTLKVEGRSVKMLQDGVECDSKMFWFGAGYNRVSKFAKGFPVAQVEQLTFQKNGKCKVKKFERFCHSLSVLGGFDLTFDSESCKCTDPSLLAAQSLVAPQQLHRDKTADDVSPFAA